MLDITAIERILPHRYPFLLVDRVDEIGEERIVARKLVSRNPATHVIYFMAIDNAKFRKPVIPGDVLTLDVVPLRKGKTIWKLRGEAKVGDVLVAEAELMAAIQPKGKE